VPPFAPDYSGPFDADVSLASFSRQALATLGREYLLNGHLQDRVGLPKVDPARHRSAGADLDRKSGGGSPLY